MTKVIYHNKIITFKIKYSISHGTIYSNIYIPSTILLNVLPIDDGCHGIAFLHVPHPCIIFLESQRIVLLRTRNLLAKSYHVFMSFYIFIIMGPLISELVTKCDSFLFQSIQRTVHGYFTFYLHRTRD